MMVLGKALKEAKLENTQASSTENVDQKMNLESKKVKVEYLISKIDIKLDQFENSMKESLAKIKAMEEHQEQNVSMTVKFSECNEEFQTKKHLKNHMKNKHAKPLNCT